MDISLERWNGITASEREDLAKRLALQLPSGFVFHAIQQYQLGEQRYHIALYQKDATTFALIPGGSVSLGYDANQAWTPHADEHASWLATAEEYDMNQTLHEHIVAVTLRPRQVDLAPFLIETTASELGWQAIELDDPEVQEILQEYGTSRQMEVVRDDVSTRIRTGPDGAVIAERSLAQTYADVAEQLGSTGFRFPTSDEWEYACGCGTSSLFRWGDHAPCDRYPTDLSPEEAAWRRRWVLSAGKLAYPEEGFRPDWDYHRQPNAFGLFIASNPYTCELVAEAGHTRGGDGGVTICGGMGFFIGWLPLATAYFEEQFCTYDPAKPIPHGYVVGRRVLDLG